MMKRALLAALLLTMSCKTTPAEPDEPVADPTEATELATPSVEETDPLEAALAHPMRTEEDRVRDAYRHPAETLEFFGVEPSDHVLELWSGGGWYTRVLTPYIAGTGKLHITSYPEDAEREYFRDMAAKMKVYLGKVEHGDKVHVIPLAPPELMDFDIEPDSLDVVLTFRNVHNWVKGGYDKAIYEASFAALKPGGTFGVVEHRGPEGMTREQSAETGYMDQKAVVEAVEAVGFELVETSEINANPKDTKDYPEGVWTLPPRLRLGDKDKAKYTAIGESDRMTLKFVKPAN